MSCNAAQPAQAFLQASAKWMAANQTLSVTMAVEREKHEEQKIRWKKSIYLSTTINHITLYLYR
jgi:hypothetical protein